MKTRAALLTIVTCASALDGVQARTTDYYPLTTGTEWVYTTDLGGTPVEVLLRNVGLKEGLHLQEARVEGKLIETKLIKADSTGVYLAATKRARGRNHRAGDPRALILYPVEELRVWEGTVEQPITCAENATGRMRAAVEGADQLSILGKETPAVRVRSAAVFRDECGKASAPLIIDYEEVSWFADGIGLVRSIITIKFGGVTYQRTIDLKAFRPARNSRPGRDM